MNELLAKSEPRTSLYDHIEDGLKILNHLKHAFPASEVITSDGFWNLLRLAVIFHDLGKGHSEFQKVLKGEDNRWYGQRHELFSLPFVSSLPLSKDDKTILQRVIIGHHKTFNKLNEQYINPNYPLGTTEFEEEFSMVDQDSIFEILISFGECKMKELALENPGNIIRAYFRERNNGEVQHHFETLLLFGAFKHCDHMASAYIDTLHHLESSTFNFLKEKYIELKNIGADFYEHQKIAKKSIGNIILTAPTGSGKTETALLWLQNQLENVGQGRVFYTLPFTASINAMFLRLRNKQYGFGEEYVGMLHGKLNAFLYEYFQDEGSKIKKEEEVKRVREMFKTLETPVKVLTPFQLLKHLFGLKGFEKGIFEWTGGYFIFDEIHAYEPGVFAQIKVLLAFLTQKMNASICIMTATLPTFIKTHIKEAIGNFDEIRASSHLYEEFDRHKLVLAKGLLSDGFDLIKEDLKTKKVLVVCNTVEQAQLTFVKLKDYSPLLIHGGFNGRDRNDKEKQLASKEPSLLIGTQAIEVSLDIDYDVIFTEIAPLDALIQRFGRVNRRRSKNICKCVVFQERNESDKYIYKQDIIDRTKIVLNSIVSDYESIVKEGELQGFIDSVYPCFDNEAESEFNTTFEALSFSINNNLYPFEHSKENEEKFYAMFDGIKVVPASCEAEYKRKLRAFDFIGAELLKVQIRKGSYARWISEGGIEKDKMVISKGNENQGTVDIDYSVLKKKYNETLGLIKKIDDHRVFDEESIL